MDAINIILLVAAGLILQKYFAGLMSKTLSSKFSLTPPCKIPFHGVSVKLRGRKQFAILQSVNISTGPDILENDTLLRRVVSDWMASFAS